MISVSPAALQEIMNRGYSKKYNARGIRRTLEKELLNPIARAMSSGEVTHSENIVMDFQGGKFLFFSMRQRVTA
jgi:ATP-dependent Clp protease ATP-binding subunit ClpB